MPYGLQHSETYHFLWQNDRPNSDGHQVRFHVKDSTCFLQSSGGLEPYWPATFTPECIRGAFQSKILVAKRDTLFPSQLSAKLLPFQNLQSASNQASLQRPSRQDLPTKPAPSLTFRTDLQSQSSPSARFAHLAPLYGFTLHIS